MKLKIIEKGYETYSDYMGGILFKDGVSVGDVNPAEARMFAALLRVEWETGQDPGDNQLYLDSMERSAPVERLKSRAELQPQPKQEVVVKTVSVGLTREELEKLADQKGIKGLRDLIDELGMNIKGNKIAELIDRILEMQGGGPQPAPEKKEPEMKVDFVDVDENDL